ELMYPALQLLCAERLLTQLAAICDELRRIKIQQIGESRHKNTSCRRFFPGEQPSANSGIAIKMRINANTRSMQGSSKRFQLSLYLQRKNRALRWHRYSMRNRRGSCLYLLSWDR